MWNWIKRKSREWQSASTRQPSSAFGQGVEYGAGQAKILVITGTSGSGRKALAKSLSERLGIPYVRSYTTRAPREGERAGEHYWFVTGDAFANMQRQDEFFEAVSLERGRYGVARTELSQALAHDKGAVVVVNREGASAFKAHFGDRVLRIFVYVTKQDVLLRLEREKASQEIIEEYLHNYTDQVRWKKESDYLLQNLDAETTVERVAAYLRGGNMISS